MSAPFKPNTDKTEPDTSNMCISANPAAFSRTTILAHRGAHPRTQRDIDVLLYQNTARSLASGGNALLLHIPAAQPMTQDNFLDTTGHPNLLEEIRSAALPQHVTRGGATRSVGKGAAQVFAHGIYHVVLAIGAEAIEDALEQVPEAKRPRVSKELLAFYEEHFPDWSFALCCFNNADAKIATPVALWYEPMFPNLLFAPALDSHTGGPPDLQARVQTDHTVVWSHPSIRGRRKVTSGTQGKLAPFLPTHVVGSQHDTRLTNGDFVLDVSGPMDFTPGRVHRFQPQRFPRPVAA